MREGNSEKKKRNFAISTVSTTSTTSDKGVNERSIAIVAMTMILVTSSRDRKYVGDFFGPVLVLGVFTLILGLLS